MHNIIEYFNENEVSPKYQVKISPEVLIGCIHQSNTHISVAFILLKKLLLFFKGQLKKSIKKRNVVDIYSVMEKIFGFYLHILIF